MKQIQFNKQFTVEKPQGQLDIFGNVKARERDYFGDELSKWFGKPMYSLYRKFGRNRSERIYNEMKKKNDKEIKHFTQLLHHD